MTTRGRARDVSVAGLCLSMMVVVTCAGQAGAELWTAENVAATVDQAPYDANQSRPAFVEIEQPQTHAMTIDGDMTGYAGTDYYPDGYRRAYYYKRVANTIANLGDLDWDFGDPNEPNDPGDPNTPNGTSRGYAINDAGGIVGRVVIAPGDASADYRPFFWIDENGNDARDGTEMRALALNPGATKGEARCVNNNGQVIITGDTGTYRAQYAYDPNTQTLTEVGSRVWINNHDISSIDMNDLGEVCWNPIGSGTGAFVWRDLNHNDAVDANEVYQIPLMNQWSSSSVSGINNVGQVIGGMRLGGVGTRSVGFIWTDLDGDNEMDWNDTNSDGYIDYDETSDEVVRFTADNVPLPSTTGNTFARDLNDLGQVTGGFSYLSGREAYVWDIHNGARWIDDLVDPGFELTMRQCEAINNKGQISGWGYLKTGGTDWYMAMISPPLYSLTIEEKNGQMGDIEILPAPLDANAPVFPADLAVTLTAVPLAGKSFKEWKIYDPNYPGDDNYVVVDTNSTITIVMMADRELIAAFKCGSSLEPLLPLIVLVSVMLVSLSCRVARSRYKGR